MLRASISVDAIEQMNIHNLVRYINHTTTNRPQRTLALFVVMFVPLLSAACLTGTSTSTSPATFPPPPQATAAVGSLLPAYPPADTTAVNPAAYPPASSPYPGPDASPVPGATLTGTDEIYFPVIGNEDQTQPTPTTTATLPPPTATATLSPSPTTSPSPTAGPMAIAQPTPINVVDFAAVSGGLAAQGQQLAFNKIGFHVTFLENADELDGYMQRLDSEGVPFFLKSVDNAEPVYKAQELMKKSGVPHVLVYRSTMYDVPNYDMDPVLAAETYWELEKAIWPPELDPGLVWFETMNELDKTRSEWLAQYSLRTAQLALRDGYKWAAFGWASGEPEPEDWESPAMLELLQLIADNPDRLAIALHEYSYTIDDIGDQFPHKIGRFLDLFAVADRHGIPRPTVLVTEWGWTYDTIPPEPLAMEDVTWAARLYGAYPQVLGAAIWNLGKLDGELLPLNTQVQGLIDNMLALSLDSYFSAPAPPEQTPLDPSLFPPPGG